MPEQSYQLRAELRAIPAREVIVECQRHDEPTLPEWLAGQLLVGGLSISPTAPRAWLKGQHVGPDDYFTFRNGEVRAVPAHIFEAQYAPVPGGAE